MNANIEVLVELFVKKDKRERMLALAAKRRGDFLHDLLHDRRSLDPGTLSPLPAGAVSVDAIAKALRTAGAGDRVYCISEVIDADDRELRLVDALVLVVGKSEDSLVFPVGSRVAYYENHEGEQCLLKRGGAPR
jgi:hypothetical protein